MISNPSFSSSTEKYYPDLDSNLSFADYIAQCQQIIQARREFFDERLSREMVVEANTPFEIYPNEPILSGEKLKYGALLIHGLLDSPFSMRDIGEHLSTKGILARSVLLPGHGTTPKDLLNVSYNDWIKAVNFGVETLKQDVEKIFLVGYSTGATLSIFQALQNPHIAGIILLSPAIRIKAPVDIVVGWRFLTKWIKKQNKLWLYREPEIDFAKYHSIPFNAVTQVAKLTALISELNKKQSLSTPLLMIISHDDETISSQRAIRFFMDLKNECSQLVLYCAQGLNYSDSRIIKRPSHYPDLNIKHMSHVSIPFSPKNAYYGCNGNYLYASHHSDESIYGAYNRIEVRWYHLLHQLGLIKQKRFELTYNPDFDFMAEKIEKFIMG